SGDRPERDHLMAFPLLKPVQKPAWWDRPANDDRAPAPVIPFPRPYRERAPTVAGISIRGTPTGNNGSSCVTSSGTTVNVSVTKPTGVVSGDVWIIDITGSQSCCGTPTVTTPTGWSLVD